MLTYASEESYLCVTFKGCVSLELEELSKEAGMLYNKAVIEELKPSVSGNRVGAGRLHKEHSLCLVMMCFLHHIQCQVRP